MTAGGIPSDIAVAVRDLGKRYRIGAKEERADTLVGALTKAVRSPLDSWRRLRRLTHFSAEDTADVLWALRHVDLDVRRGEVLGIIGRNGAGKSTFLKILSRITFPTEGRVLLRGDLSSLLEIGSGFHPELTGRENVYLNGTILGLTKRQIDQRFDQIVDFAGVETFLDTPVKRYSSGMRVRLAFSVAAHLQPEILLIDEVLAVGDSAFQQKCLGKMRDIGSSGRTVLFVSHNLTAISALCHRVVLLDRGRLTMEGRPDEVISHYLETTLDRPDLDLSAVEERRGSGRLRITGISLKDRDGKPVPAVQIGQDIHFVLSWTSDSTEPLRDVTFDISLHSPNGDIITTLWTEYTGESFSEVPPIGSVACTVPRFPISTERCMLSLSVLVQGQLADAIGNAGSFTVVPASFYSTPRLPKRTNTVLLNHHWHLVEGSNI